LIHFYKRTYYECEFRCTCIWGYCLGTRIWKTATNYSPCLYVAAVHSGKHARNSEDFDKPGLCLVKVNSFNNFIIYLAIRIQRQPPSLPFQHSLAQPKKQPNILFLNLALADCLATVFTIAGQLIWEIMDKDWQSSDVFCKLFKFFQTLGITSSTYMLVAISLDRLWAIVYPLNVHPSAGRLATITWFISVIPCLPNLYLFNTWHDETTNQEPRQVCVSKLYSHKDDFGGLFRQVYFLVIISVVFLIPFFLTISFNIRIILTLCRQFHRLGELPDQPRICCHSCVQRPNASPETSSQERVGQVHNRGLIPRARVKVLNLSLAFVITFLVTNVPYAIHELCIAYIGQNSLSKKTSSIIGILPPLNSAINPIIYLLFNSQAYWTQVLTTECCPLTSFLFIRLAAFTNHQPTPRRNMSFRTSSSLHLHRINPELVGAPVHVSHNYPADIEPGEQMEMLQPHN